MQPSNPLAMKKSSFILLTIFLTCSLSACKKFLTVNPKTELTQDVLFETEGGFKDALTGVYIQMKSASSYGESLTQTTVEQLVSSWDIVTNSTEQRLGLFNYADEGVQTRLEQTFAQQYKIIASINAILGQIDAKKSVLRTNGMYETIKSECLALRAYIHLDILRLYGPIPTAPQNGSMLAYVRTISNTPNERISFDAYKTALFKDLNDAELLVKDIDPITKYSLPQLKAPGNTSVFNPADLYFAYRYLRMNYYAIKAVEARAHLWFGNKAEAYQCAKVLIDAKNSDGSPKFRFGTAADMTAKDFVLTSEHIFGLYDFQMFTKYSSMYASGTLKKGSAATTVNTQLYGNTGTDIREANLWELVTLANAAKCYIYKKYQAIEKPSTVVQDFKQIPMLRISEMYLIAVETAPAGEAQMLWNTFRAARNIPNTTLPTDPQQLQFEVVKEMRKEFYAEGQAFYAYKRINAPKANFLFAPTAATVNYVLPLPTNESINLN